MMSTSSILDQVEITARYPVWCADNNTIAAVESPFKLGPLDALVFASVPIECVFVYEKPADSPNDGVIPIERLRQGLSCLLNYYPHLTGRIQFSPQTRAPEIGNLGTGAELLEAECDIGLDGIASLDCNSDRILLTNLPGCGSELTPPFDSSMEAISREPILAIQRTQFSCGGVVLGIRLHHIVCDASGLFQLTRDLAELYQGLSSSSRPALASPPVIRSYLHDSSILSEEERQEALEYLPVAYCADHGPHMLHPGQVEFNIPPRPPITGRSLRFSGDDLTALKEMAKDPNEEGCWVSTFEALSAYLYQRVYRARIQLLTSKEAISASEAGERISRGLGTSINMRSPQRLNLPPKYFPNAVCPSYSMTSHELLMNGPLWKVTQSLHNQIRAVTARQMQQTTRWIAVQPDKSRIKINFTFAVGNFMINQWSQFGMYMGVDFDRDGLGRPITPSLVGPPFTDMSRIDGLATILSTEEEVVRFTRERDESCLDAKKPCAIDVNLTLVDPLWDILDEDEQSQG